MGNHSQSNLSSSGYILPERIKSMYPHQVRVLEDRTRFKTLVWHRRARKTSTALEKVVMEAFNPHLKNKVYWIVFPTYAEAKEAVWKDPNMLFRVLPEEMIARTNEQELTCYLKNGNIISLKGADDPDRLRGAGPYGLILDEFATMKYEAWQILEPIVRASGGWAWFIGTPKGKNHLYDFYNRGVKPGGEWKSWRLQASTSGVIPYNELAAAKESMSEAMFNQEFECDFLEGEGQVFRNVRAVATAVPSKPIEGRLYVIGADLAKVQDYTALVVYDRMDNSQVYQERIKTLEWPFQKKKIQALAQHYNNAIVAIDATGIGDPIADDLLRARVAVEPIKISSTMKKELIEKLSIWIEQETLKMLPIGETLLEFDNFTYEIGPSGRVRYGAPQGYHDDIVIAHALAVWLLQPEGSPRSLAIPKSKLQLHRERVKRDAQRSEEEEYIQAW